MVKLNNKEPLCSPTGDIKEEFDRSTSVPAGDEDISSTFDERSAFQKIVDEHIDPLKLFCIEHDIPFVLAAVTAKNGKASNTFALGYLPSTRATTPLRMLADILQRMKENRSVLDPVDDALLLAMAAYKHALEGKENLTADDAFKLAFKEVMYIISDRKGLSADEDELNALLNSLV